MGSVQSVPPSSSRTTCRQALAGIATGRAGCRGVISPEARVTPGTRVRRVSRNLLEYGLGRLQWLAFKVLGGSRCVSPRCMSSGGHIGLQTCLVGEAHVFSILL